MTLSTLTPLVSSTCGFGAATHGPSFEELGNFLPLVFAKGFRSLARDPAQRSLSIFNLVNQLNFCLPEIAGKVSHCKFCLLAFKISPNWGKWACLGSFNIGGPTGSFFGPPSLR